MGPWPGGGPTRIRSFPKPQAASADSHPPAHLSGLFPVGPLSYLVGYVTIPHFHQVPLKTLMRAAQRLEA